MFGLGPMEIAICIVVIIVVFGPKRIPAIARGIGEAISEFRKVGREIDEPGKGDS